MNYRYLLLGLLLVGLIVVPASADLIVKGGNPAFNASGTLYSSGYYHDSGYVPEMYVWFAIIIGIICLVVSTYVETEINIFVLITPVFWAYAAWFSAYMEREIVSTVPGADGTIQVVYTEVVFSQPMLQYAMTFLFVLSVLFAIYVLFLKEPDQTYDSQRNVR